MRLALRPLSIAMLGLAVLAVAQPTLAGYSTETVTVSFGPASVPHTDSSVAFQLFDSKLGTLESVTLVLSQTATVSSSVTNNSSTTMNNYSVYSYDSVIATGPDGKQVGSSVISSTVMGSISTNSMLSNLGQTTATASSNAVSAVNLSSYIGAGTGTMSISGTITTVGVNQGGSPNPYLFFGGSATYSGTVQITYQYNAVPEPASLGMVAIGLGAFTLAGRFRRPNKHRVA